ncbi:hypothetical protein H0H92_005552 [Tricholoma furcatifolium]|nr:hypothetical protein H0H92_005552 [Tricholoma furcatifolium]
MRFYYILTLISSISIVDAVALNASYVLIHREPSNRLWPVGAYSYPPPTRIRRSASPSPMVSSGPVDARPTPDPTGDPSSSTTVHINDERDFALILPNKPGELIGDAEADGVSYCSPGGDPAVCKDKPSFVDNFVLAAAVSKADDDSWIQITGCINSNASALDPNDAGGQFDVRYPNGAQCTFGGYGASFIELYVVCLFTSSQLINDQLVVLDLRKS